MLSSQIFLTRSKEGAGEREKELRGEKEKEGEAEKEKEEGNEKERTISRPTSDELDTDMRSQLTRRPMALKNRRVGQLSDRHKEAPSPEQDPPSEKILTFAPLPSPGSPSSISSTSSTSSFKSTDSASSSHRRSSSMPSFMRGNLHSQISQSMESLREVGTEKEPRGWSKRFFTRRRLPASWDEAKEDDEDDSSSSDHVRSRSLSMTKIGAKKKVKTRCYSVETLRPRKEGFTESSISISRNDVDGTGQINHYTILREIGKGSYGTVKEAISALDGKHYAIKVISKSRLKKTKVRANRFAGPRSRSPVGKPVIDELEEIKVEIAVLKKISKHPYFVRLVEFLSSESDDFVYMVFELCEKGAIMKMVTGKEVPHFKEHEAQKYFRQLVLSIEYLHFQKIIHRDIKPENILLNSNNDIQLADFGVAHIFEGGEDWLRSSQGSPAFCSPEVCSSASNGMFHGKAVDVWAMGVTLYCFVFGRCPFEASNIPALYRTIIQEEVKFPWEVNPFLQHLISRMLEKDPEKRITIPEIRENPWVTDGGENPLPSKAENCQLVEVTAEEVSQAVSKVKTFGTKLLELFKGKRRQNRSSDELSHLSRIGSPPLAAPPKDDGPRLTAAEKRRSMRRSSLD